MVCEFVPLPGGGHAIICGSRPRRERCACGHPATLLCDWKVPNGYRKSQTCDKPLCPSCTTSPAPDKDLCPHHAQLFEAWREKRSENHNVPEAHP